MSTTHTPGPWAVDVMPGEVVVYEAVTLENIDICKMGGNNNDGANARLIAAAPDMLAALRAALKALQTCMDGDYSTGHVIHPYHDEKQCAAAEEACAAAIAKAVTA